jgi:putative Mg2+ transporter-C (MgtC) family protein
MDIELIFQLLLATFLGALIGLEREIKGKEAGLRTFSLVTLGSCLFTLISLSFPGFNPAILAIGIGFLGAGVISQQSAGIVGLTTAAALWMSAAIGAAIGLKLYLFATFSTLLAVLILAGFGIFEGKAFKKE